MIWKQITQGKFTLSKFTKIYTCGLCFSLFLLLLFACALSFNKDLNKFLKNPDQFSQYLWGESEAQASVFFNILDDCNVQPGWKATGLISCEKQAHSKAINGPDKRYFQLGGVRYWGGKRSDFVDVMKPPAWAEEVLKRAVVMCFFPVSVC